MPRVTVVGAGKYGSTTVQRLAEKGICDEVVMTDIIEGLPQGLALDMNQSRPIEGFETRVVGSNGYEETAGSDVVVITAGVPRKPGMSRMDLLETNARIVGEVTRKVADASPDAVLIVVSNPLDEMTALAAEVSGFPRERVMGQAGMLDTARFKHFLAEELGTSPSRVEAMTLGSHGDTMVPVPSMVKVDGKPLTEVADAATIERLVQRTRDGGAEVVALLKSGSAYYAPSSAAAAMVEAVLGDTGEVMPVCAWVTGQYGIDGVYLGVPARLGRAGVAEVVELPLTDGELADLREAAEAVRSKQADVAKLGGFAGRAPGGRGPGLRPVRGRAGDALVPRGRHLLGGGVPDLPHTHGGVAPPRRRPAGRRARPHAGPAGRGGRGPPRGRRLPARPGDAPHPRPLPRPPPRPRLARVRLEPVGRRR